MNLRLLIVVLSIAIIFLLARQAFSQDNPEFYIPVPTSPGSSEVVIIKGYSPEVFDYDNFILRSEETGLYPTFGWTGEYYVTGVTHGAVHDEHRSFTGNNHLIRRHNDEVRSPAMVPAPTSMSMILVLFILLIMRRPNLEV